MEQSDYKLIDKNGVLVAGFSGPYFYDFDKEGDMVLKVQGQEVQGQTLVKYHSRKKVETVVEGPSLRIPKPPTYPQS